MTSSPGKYAKLIVQRAFLIACVTALPAAALSAGNGCLSPPAPSCAECLGRGPHCAWCFQDVQAFPGGAEISQRCDSLQNLRRNGCEEQFIEQHAFGVQETAKLPGTQVSPQEVTLQMWPGVSLRFPLHVQQLQRYPVDMYYLLDVSASMQDHLDRLKTVGVSLSQRMKAHSSDFRVGFGSFVDKPVSPYINVHPSKISNPCSDYGIQCRPAHGFIHVLPLTDNTTEFTRVIREQSISGNMDTPEGGFDAILQTAVCQEDIGWRTEAKRLLLVMTDQPSHLALDSRLAGIVVPHDGNCHLENNTYTHSTRMEHPTVGLLAEKLLENSIYSIFAVEQLQYKWYEQLSSLLPGTHLGKLQPKAANLRELVVDAYKKLLSIVEVDVRVQDHQVHRFRVNVTAICPEGSRTKGSNKCSEVRPNQTVLFNISVSMLACPEEEEVLIFIRPVGFNESTLVRVRPTCACRCGQLGECQDEPGQTEPSGTQPSQAPCSSRPEETERGWDCRPGGAGGRGPDCSGRGSCVCGHCVCENGTLGRYCQLEDLTCPYRHGLICAGRGHCVAGECRCGTGWGSCDCPSSSETCLSQDGVLCSGRGSCVCGRCECDDPRGSGDFCEKCPTCEGSCQSHWKCVHCHLANGFTEGMPNACNQSCPLLVDFVHDIPGSEDSLSPSCLYPAGQRCHYRFQTDSGPGPALLWLSTRPECPSSPRYLPTFVAVFLLTFLLGLAVLVLLSWLLRRQNRALDESKSAVYDVTNQDTLSTATANEKTVTCQQEQQLEMRTHSPKTPLHNVGWQ
ncbi:hypothetical protein MATL_G00227260 [Megalops atlanticus]|uniref:Integrin beta n=1 Tax=Megalops atlanticus TaxID=7932 RepID=A0A9D3PG77_MEGAT|nr:hypothetical protein MATL_G00227260 [Megalops atlanticus]